MAKIYINTTNVETAGKNIKKQAAELDKVINEMFESIKKLEENGVWIGDGAVDPVKKYINYALKSKSNYTNVTKSIDKLGDDIIGYSTEMEKISDIKV